VEACFPRLLGLFPSRKEHKDLRFFRFTHILIAIMGHIEVKRTCLPGKFTKQRVRRVKTKMASAFAEAQD